MRTHPPLQRSILIVEDELEIVKLLQTVLEEDGFQVFTSRTAEQGIDCIDKSRDTIDLVIADMMLPGMNGVMMSERIKASHPDTQFLFMSGYSADVIKQFGIENESPSYLAKPFSIDSLLEKIHAILNPSAS